MAENLVNYTQYQTKELNQLLDDYSVIGAQVYSEKGNFVFLRHFFKSTAVTNSKSISEKTCFPSRSVMQHVLSYHLI